MTGVGLFASDGEDTSVWHQIFNFDNYGELLGLVQNSLLAGALVGLVGGLVGVFVIMRDLPFAVHGISELSFAGASAALLLGLNIVAGSIAGSLLAAGAIGVLGVRARDRNSIIGIIMPFGLGLGVLFLSLYKGRAANKFGILTGQIIAVDTPQMAWLVGTSVVVLIALAIVWKPLTFASVDPEVAAARGVPVRALSLVFMLVLGLAVALCVQIVGALLVLALLVTPAAAAARITASPVLLPVLSVAFAMVSMEGGILLALGSTVPISPYVTTISFAIYLVCRLASTRRANRAPRTVLSAPEQPAVRA
ncbi:ABC transporter permease [Streptomyces lunaelactis]|uniref:ABC transporter permease n=1 Tax=Streptomyces lunaelactis TaxID=1535768 RepID=A0A2R4SWJ3_9ACTN|nr:metal ABC transporter permease [Streptomyces lunaelactis]AVZ71251.1 ABC transporter permease [Streptomyces lunaelactis]NUK88164.1 metal ABC transporter permease [Streptomyces lunaelactis]NUL05363.1 metal ABC transporter permease [Streptomyces lunaelactis]